MPLSTLMCTNIHTYTYTPHSDRPGMPRIAVIHGDKTQKDREFAISNFKSGFSPILVQKLPSFYFVVL